MHNIILIITDTFRYDNLGTRAEMPVRTPELDRFADQVAVEIHGVYTGSFPTIPHRTDIATGRLGWPHFPWQPIENSSRNHVAAMLNSRDYVTQLICDCPHLFNAHFNGAFQGAFQHRGQEGDKPLLHLNDPIETAMPRAKTRVMPLYRDKTLADVHRWANRYPRNEDDLFPARTGATAARWLEDNYKAGPFFLWVDFFDPHEPWDAPEYLVSRYDPAYAGAPMIHPNYGRSDDFTDEELRNLRAHYCAEAELVDRSVGRVLQKIDDLQLWQNSVVVVTSDHGMSLGEHARTGKTNINDGDDRRWPIYPEVGHVPFLIAAPGLANGTGLKLLAQPIDVLPTVADLAGVALDPPEPFHGRSFADSLRENRAAFRDCAVSGCCLGANDYETVPAKATTPFLVTPEWGYAPIGPDGRPELYALTRDPLARTNVIAGQEPLAGQLHDMLIAHLQQGEASDATIAFWRKMAP